MKKLTRALNGFEGYYYPCQSYSDCAVIVVGWAGSNEKMCKIQASVYMEAGFSVLTVGMYGWKGMSKILKSVPVEYIENAVEWLKSHGKTKIAMAGISTGAGYTLLSASLIADISAVIAVSPFDYVMEACIPPKYSSKEFKTFGSSVYTWRGKDVSFSRWTISDNYFDNVKKCFKNDEYGKKRLIRYIYDNNEILSESRIKIEDMHARALLLAADNDDMWPSEQTVCRAKQIFESNNYQYKVNTHIYPKASHILGVSFSKYPRIMKFFVSVILRKSILAECMYPSECDTAREDSVEKIKSFLEDWAV